MVNCNDFLDCLLSYETPKIVLIRSRTIGIFSLVISLTIFSYIVGYVLVYKKGYQQFGEVESSATTKVKGIAFTNFSDEEFSSQITNHELYNRIWDVADFVIPPSENAAVFVATNVVITDNQTKSICPEDVNVPGAECDPSSPSCKEDEVLPAGNGVMTGTCVPIAGNATSKRHSCAVKAWCPVEIDVNPLKNNTALLRESQNFTLLIKNFVHFPLFKNSNRRNIKDTSNKTYLEHCLYDNKINNDCPVFRLGDIVQLAGHDYDKMALKGGVISIVINWDCNLDFDKKYCIPSYSFSRLDNPNAKLAPGWNFRYANYFSDDSRTLFKVYGIKFVIIVQGQAGKFHIVPLLLNVGAGLGLFAIQAVLCDLVVLYMVKRRHYYKSKKYEEVKESDEFLIVPYDSTLR